LSFFFFLFSEGFSLGASSSFILSLFLAIGFFNNATLGLSRETRKIIGSFFHVICCFTTGITKVRLIWPTPFLALIG
jgi:hypothetical protein